MLIRGWPSYPMADTSSSMKRSQIPSFSSHGQRCWPAQQLNIFFSLCLTVDHWNCFPWWELKPAVLCRSPYMTGSRGTWQEQWLPCEQDPGWWAEGRFTGFFFTKNGNGFIVVPSYPWMMKMHSKEWRRHHLARLSSNGFIVKQKEIAVPFKYMEKVDAWSWNLCVKDDHRIMRRTCICIYASTHQSKVGKFFFLSLFSIQCCFILFLLDYLASSWHFFVHGRTGPAIFWSCPRRSKTKEHFGESITCAKNDSARAF